MRTKTNTLKKLGQLLVDFGWIDQPQLEQALQTQRVVGGRLGSCLLEVGAIDEAMLLRALAHQRAVPAARTIDLATVPGEVISLLPSRVALRCLAIPFRMLGPDLYVALLDAANLDLHDEIAFATGKQVRIHIANEVRIFSSLHRYYDRELSDRYRLLEDYLDRPVPTVPRSSGFGRHLERKNATPPPTVPSNAVSATSPLAELDTAAANANRGPRSVGSTAAHALSPRASATPQFDSPAPSLRPPSAVTSPFLRRFENVELFSEALAEVEDREAMALMFVEHLRPHFERLLLFKVLPETVVGWVGSGAGINQTRLLNSQIRVDRPSIFHDLLSGRAMYQGPLASLSAHRDVFAAFGGEPPEECLFVPIRLGQRLVSVVIGEPAPSHDPAATRDEIALACNALGQAFASYLVRQRASSD